MRVGDVLGLNPVMCVRWYLLLLTSEEHCQVAGRRFIEYIYSADNLNNHKNCHIYHFLELMYHRSLDKSPDSPYYGARILLILRSFGALFVHAYFQYFPIETMIQSSDILRL